MKYFHVIISTKYYLGIYTSCNLPKNYENNPSIFSCGIIATTSLPSGVYFGEDVANNSSIIPPISLSPSSEPTEIAACLARTRAICLSISSFIPVLPSVSAKTSFRSSVAFRVSVPAGSAFIAKLQSPRSEISKPAAMISPADAASAELSTGVSLTVSGNIRRSPAHLRSDRFFRKRS